MDGESSSDLSDSVSISIGISFGLSLTLAVVSGISKVSNTSMSSISKMSNTSISKMSNTGVSNTSYNTTVGESSCDLANSVGISLTVGFDSGHAQKDKCKSSHLDYC